MRISGPLFLIACPFLVHSALAQVVNDASGSPGIVPGSLARIYAPNNPGSSLNLSSASVSITQNGATFDAPVVSVPASSFLIARIPSDVTIGPATVGLQSAGAQIAQFAVNVVPTNFGIYSQTPARLTKPALPGDFITLWGTGLGRYSEASVLIGGHAAPITYIGPAPGSPGLDQINVQVPDDAAIPNDCAVALQIQADGTASNVISLPKATAPGTCQSSAGLSADEIAQLDAGQRVVVGQFTINSYTGPPISGPSDDVSRQESAQGYFSDIDAAGLGSIGNGPLVADDQNVSCSTGQSGLGRLIRVGLLNGGDKFVLNGPVATFDLPANSNLFPSFYSFTPPPSDNVTNPAMLPAPAFGPGDWMLSDPVGKDVLPFQQPFVLPRQIVLDKIVVGSAVDHRTNQTFTWDAASFTPSDRATVTLQGTGSVPASQWFNVSSSYSVSCSAPANTGRVTIPAALLAPFTASDSGNKISIYVLPRPGHVNTFRIPLAKGGSVPGLLSYQFSETVPVVIR